jgi:hypothetical protein
MFRSIRVPRTLDKFFRPLHGHVHGDHCEDFRWLVLVMVFAWGRHHVANVSRYLDAQHHRTRFNHFFLVQRWDPEAALRQQARELRRALAPRPGDPVDLLRDDATKATRGKRLEAVAKMQDPTTAAALRGHPYVCGTRLFREHVIPWGIRLDVTQAACAAVGAPVRKTTALAAQLMREVNAPAGVKVVVLFAAYDRGPPVVKAGREPHVHVAATLQSHRHLLQPGWKLQAGRDGRNLLRRRRPATLVITKPHGRARYRVVAAGWLPGGHRGRLQVVFSRTGRAQKILGLVTDAPELSAAQLIQTDDRRWTLAPWVQDVKPRLGLGQYQHRSYGAAVTHRHLVCFAYALLTYLRLHQAGAQGHRTYDKAADLSTATAQDQLRRLLWGDLSTSLKEARQDHPVIEELERFRVA